MVGFFWLGYVELLAYLPLCHPSGQTKQLLAYWLACVSVGGFSCKRADFGGAREPRPYCRYVGLMYWLRGAFAGGGAPLLCLSLLSALCLCSLPLSRLFPSGGVGLAWSSMVSHGAIGGGLLGFRAGHFACVDKHGWTVLAGYNWHSWLIDQEECM